jgi:hypothetical protein
VIIIGLTRRDMEPTTKRLFSYDDVNGDAVESRHIFLATACAAINCPPSRAVKSLQ